MRIRLTVQVIVVLFALSILLAFISTTTEYKLMYEDSLPYYLTTGMSNYVHNLNLPDGYVRAMSKPPSGVRIYLLTNYEYNLYNQTKRLPIKYLNCDNEEIWVANPSFLLIQKSLDEEVKVIIHIRIYRRIMPYSFLALPAYILALVAISLSFIKFLRMLGE